MDFLFSFALFIVLHLIVGASAAVLGARLHQFAFKNWTQLILTITTLTLTQIIISQIILGIIGQLYILPVFIINTVILLGVAILWGKRALITKLPDRPSWTRKELLFILLFFGPALIIFILRFFNAAFQIPLEYDNVAYHLPFVADWYKSGSLFPVYYSAFAGPIGYYPSNIELLDLWLVLPFGKDYFVNFLNFSVFLLLPIAFYGVAKNFKISSLYALVPALLFLYMPQSFRQMGVPLVDIYFTLLFLLSIYFLKEYAHSKNSKDILLFGLSIGLFIGTKYLGIIYSMPLLFVAFVQIIIAYRQLQHPKNIVKKFWAPLGILAGATFLTGGFWYVRNWIEAGNPLFPVEVKALGLTLFEGYYGLTDRVLSYSLAYNVHDWQTLKVFLRGYFQMIGLPGILIVAVMPILALFLLNSIVRYFKIPYFKKRGTDASHITHHATTKTAEAQTVREQTLKEQTTNASDIADRTTATNAESDWWTPALLLSGALFYFYFYWRAPFTYRDLLPNLRYAMMFLALGCFGIGWVCSRLHNTVKHWFPGKHTEKRVLQIVYSLLLGMIVYNLIALVFFPSGNIVNNDRILIDYALIQEYSLLFIIFVIIHILLFSFIKSIVTKPLPKSGKMVILSMLGLFIASSYFFNSAFAQRESLKNRFLEMWHEPEPISITRAVAQTAFWFDEYAPDAAIAYTGFNFHYHFFGHNLQRDVNYININECTECNYKDYRKSPDSIRRDPNFLDWLNNLKTKHKEYLVVAPFATPDVHSWEYQWTQEHPEIFEKVLQQGNVYTYKINYPS